MTNKILEVVVYTVKEGHEETFINLRNTLKSESSKHEGFVSAETRKSIEKPNQYVDIVYWDSLESSKNAAKVLNEMPEIKAFFETIEKTTVIDHFNEIISS